MSEEEPTKSISDDRFLRALDAVLELRDQTKYPTRSLGASVYDMGAVLSGHPEDVLKIDGARERYHYDELPEEVILAKAKALISKGLIEGCACGCRGDFLRVEPTLSMSQVRAAEEGLVMSYVTDLTMIFPNWNDAKFFEKIYTEQTGFGLESLESDGGKVPGNYVYTFGLNYLLGRAPDLLDILERGPWARGTVLYVCHEEDEYPTVTVFGEPSS